MKDLLAKGKEVPNGQGFGEREARMDAAGDGELGFLAFFFVLGALGGRKLTAIGQLDSSYDAY